ncbi:hypothetical protein HY641_00330 [Candidatus Woesearchaeota archaeon]|nr:hypothetical protein [Candidatus Woesearchaeota archaeon]
MKFVIEHLELKVSAWVKLEYSEISRIVGKSNLIFTNVKTKNLFLEGLGAVRKESITSLQFPKMIVLDPAAKQELTPADCTHYDYLVFGGILGDYPPRARTREELTSKLPADVVTRHLGPLQMSTDTAVRVAKMICDGKKLSEIPFVDNISIELGEYECVGLPYRYVRGSDGEPVFAKGLVQHLKKKRTF